MLQINWRPFATCIFSLLFVLLSAGTTLKLQQFDHQVPARTSSDVYCMFHCSSNSCRLVTVPTSSKSFDVNQHITIDFCWQHPRRQWVPSSQESQGSKSQHLGRVNQTLERQARAHARCIPAFARLQALSLLPTADAKQARLSRADTTLLRAQRPRNPTPQTAAPPSLQSHILQALVLCC